jgi:hypothetical protein
VPAWRRIGLLLSDRSICYIKPKYDLCQVAAALTAVYRPETRMAELHWRFAAAGAIRAAP